MVSIIVEMYKKIKADCEPYDFESFSVNVAK